jgi:propanol-preferring alcohol dehydrogenase
VPPLALIFRGIEVLGSLTGTPVQNEQNLAFAATQGVRAWIEPAKLDGAAGAYDRMMSGAARFRMVLSV